jgi:hypothetical protein
MDAALVGYYSESIEAGGHRYPSVDAAGNSMTDSNGTGDSILKIGTEGRLKMAFGDRQAFEIDVLQVNSAWVAIDAAFRGPDGQIPRERIQELNQELWAFVLGIAAGTITNEDLNLTMCLRFIKHVTEEADRLKDFFDVKSRGEPSSPERTELIYSQ